MNINQQAPAIFVSRVDYDRLIALAMGLERRDPRLAEFLITELERATLIESSGVGVKAAGMYSHVEFRNDSDGRVQCVTLVYPNEEDIATGKISILTPIGAALIGMTENQSIEWEGRNGKPHKLTVMKIHN